MELENMNNAQIEAGAVNPEGYAEGPHMEEHGAEPHTSQEPENGGMNAEGGQQADPKPFQPQEQPWKTPENAMAAQRRREMEAARRERMFREVTDGMVDPRTNQPFANEQAWRDWKNEMAVKAAAQKAGIDTAAAQTVMDDLRENLRQTDPEYQRMARENEQAKAAMAQQTFEQDLRSIKKAYPDEKAKSVMELGPEFMAIMATGQVSAVTAYEAIRAQRARSAPKPVSTGAIGGGQKQPGAHYTKEQVEAMSPKEVHEHYDDIRKSMKSW